MSKDDLKDYVLNILWGIGDWGLGIGDWGLGIGPNPQSPIPIPNPQSPIFLFFFIYHLFNLILFIQDMEQQECKLILLSFIIT